MTDIFPISDAMKELIKKGKHGREAVYPWDKLTVGKCFTIPDHTIKFQSLMTNAYRYGKRHGKVFKVAHHVESKLYEVALIEDKNIQLKVEDLSFKIADPNKVMREMGE